MAGSMTNVMTNEVQAEGTQLTNQDDVCRDKAVFVRVLRDIVAHDRTGHAVDLSLNEAILRLIPVLCDYFSHEELVDLIGEPLTNQVFEMYRVEMLQNLFLENELRRVLRAFHDAGIPLMLFKGPVLAYTIYSKPHLRTYHDIDALIQPGDVARASAELTSMGYSFFEEYRADAIDEQRTGYHFSLQRAGFPFAVIVELHTAPHESEIGTLFDREALWERASPMTILDQSALVMNPVDHLLYLCWHYRFHGFSRLLWFYDIVMMSRTYADTLDWDRLIEIAHRQRQAATLYYCLSWCSDMFSVPLPAKVLAGLRPPLVSRLVVERIALPDTMIGLAVERFQERRLLARRAMVDSNGELLKAALRTLFPSPVALQKRYMEHSRLPLRLFFLFYFIHPWITCAKGCRNFFNSRQHGKDWKEIV